MIRLESSPILAIDFDGTCVSNINDYPKVGSDIGAAPWLKAFVSAGARLILWTVRSGDGLKPAVKWFKDNKIPLWGINENIDYSQPKSPKAHAHLFIDDRAFGAPVIKQENGQAHIDWNKVGPAVLAELLKKKD